MFIYGTGHYSSSRHPPTHTFILNYRHQPTPHTLSHSHHGIIAQCSNFRTIYGCYSKLVGIDSLELIPGLLKSLKIPSHTGTKIPFMYSQKRNCAASVPVSTFMCLWAILIFPGLVHIFSCIRIGRPIQGIYKSLTESWMLKLGLRPRNSFSGDICFEFSVLCLCSGGLQDRPFLRFLVSFSFDRLLGWPSDWRLDWTWD
jgi:hypothetical protein